jgi:hypothetical protein
MAAALDADPEAGFAYGIVQLVGDHGPEGTANHFGWDPGNHVHTPVLVRPGGGVDLTGLRGAHVREFVGSSRVAVPAGVSL